MSKVTKTTASFFAAMLFFISISAENYGLLLTSQDENNKSENSDSFFSKEKPDLFFLNRQEEKLVTPVKKLPFPNFKNHTNDFYTKSLSYDVRRLSINSEYLSYKVTVYRNLTISDIVFPFHYFW